MIRRVRNQPRGARCVARNSKNQNMPKLVQEQIDLVSMPFKKDIINKLDEIQKTQIEQNETIKQLLVAIKKDSAYNILD